MNTQDSGKKCDRCIRKFIARFLGAILLILWVLLTHSGLTAQVDIPGPPGSAAFGTSVFVLPNGNLLVTDPTFNGPEPQDESIGAVYLYDGVTLSLISTLTGSSPHDTVGSSITILSNGNFLVRSPYWANGVAAQAGAVTWGSQMTGVSGVVSASNSLVGTATGDQVGSGGIVVLSNGHYVVSSPLWNNGATVHVGAVTWGDANAGVAGPVGADNSLVGGRAGDQVGSRGVVALPNGNYLVSSGLWANGAMPNVGALTWCDGSTGRVGAVSAINSLVGAASNDSVGSDGITILSNGNFVVRSPYWSGFRGAVTWGSGTTGVVGAVSAVNSLVGSKGNDSVGSDGVTPLPNGHYLVQSPFWDNGQVVNVGAVTWGNGTSGVRGTISVANSLVGNSAQDRIGSDYGGITVLANGNYVVSSPYWDNGNVLDVGAVTWGSGTTGISGLISSVNSLVGSRTDDSFGSFVIALHNGNYLVSRPNWDNGSSAPEAGAVTWGSGTSGVKGVITAANSLVGGAANDFVGEYGRVITLSTGNYVVNSPRWNGSRGAVTWGGGTDGVKGIVSTANSLVGSTPYDLVGNGGITVLSNGNYVVSSPNWADGALENVGAVTWGNGLTGVKGAVSTTNSLVGSNANDYVGAGAVAGLFNGNYVIVSWSWRNGELDNAGAVTWGDGAIGVTGAVSSANSLVGGTALDRIGSSGVTPLASGNYLVRSPSWHNGAVVNAGAVTWCNGTNVLFGEVSSANSLIGSLENDSVGNSVVTELANGNYLVNSPSWSSFRGAVTWGSGKFGVTGQISATNSLIGATDGDLWGATYTEVAALSNGNYVVSRPKWDNEAATDAGAVSLGDGTAGTIGVVSAANSIFGTVADYGSSMVYTYDYVYGRLIVGQPWDNRVSLFTFSTSLRTRQNDLQLNYRDDYQLELKDGPGETEYGAYIKTDGGFDPLLRLADSATARELYTSSNLVGTTDQFLLLFTNVPPLRYELQVRSAEPGQTGSYEVAVYPVVRPGGVIASFLTGESRVVTNRLAGPAGSQWRAEDYLVQGFGEGELLDVSVESTSFDGYVEILDLRTEEVLVFNNDGVGGGTNARVVFAMGRGSNYVVRATSYQPSSTGSYTLRVRPVLPLGRRAFGQLGEGDQLAAAGGNYYDDFTLNIQGASGGGELAIFAVSKGGYVPQLRLYEPLTETTVSTSNSMVGTRDQFLLLFTNQPGRSYSAQVSSLEPGATGDYEIGLYPVVRPGQEVSGDLTVGAAQGSEYHAREYLLWEMSRGQTARLRLESASFDGKLEVVSLSQPTNVLITAEPGSGGPGVAQVEFTHRDENYLVRVTSGTPDQTGNYRLVVERKLPVVTGFSPVGTNVGGTVVLSGDFFPVDNRATTWVGFGGGVWAKPTSPNIQPGTITLTVPPGAVTGPLTVTNLNGSFTSAEVFQVGTESPRIRAVSLGANGQFGIEITGAAGGAMVIETAANLNQPIQWLPVVTNQIPVSGTLIHTVTITNQVEQQFFRTRML